MHQCALLPLPLQYLLSPLLRGLAFLPPRRLSFSCSLSASFAPSPADLAASSWSINYNFLTLTITLAYQDANKDPEKYALSCRDILAK